MCQSIWGLVQEFLHYEDFFSSSPHNVSSTSWPTRQQRAYLVFLNVGMLLLKFLVFENYDIVYAVYALEKKKC